MNFKVFLINLDSSKDRLAYMDQQLNQLGLAYERVSAFWGKDYAQHSLNPLNSKRFLIETKRLAEHGEVGCAMSHRYVWEQILKDGLDYALILEDDVRIDQQILDLLEAKILSTGLDLINLSSQAPYQIDFKSAQHAYQTLGELRPKKWQLQSKKLWSALEWRRSWRIYKLIKLNNFYLAECDPAPALASGYLVSRKAAKHLLHASKSLHTPIDLVWRHSSGSLRQAFLVEPLITQSLDDSSIGGRTQTKLGFTLSVLRFFLKSRRFARRLDLLRLYGIFRH